MGAWAEWLAPRWPELVNGAHLEVAPELPHPAKDAWPWERIPIAEPHGQIDDWALSLSDGSRLHVHVFEDRTTVHRDAIDPAGGPLAALRHYVNEGRTAPAVMGAGLVAATVAIARKVLRPG